MPRTGAALVARASRPCDSKHTGGTPVPLPRFMESGVPGPAPNAAAGGGHSPFGFRASFVICRRISEPNLGARLTPWPCALGTETTRRRSGPILDSIAARRKPAVSAPERRPPVRRVRAPALASSCRAGGRRSAATRKPLHPAFRPSDFSPQPYPCSRTGVASVSDIVWNGFSGRILMAVTSHLLERPGDGDGDRRDACPTTPATPFAWFASASLRRSPPLRPACACYLKPLK